MNQERERRRAAARPQEAPPEATIDAVRQCLALGDFGTAAEQCEGLLRSYPNAPVLLRFSGLSLEGLGDYDGALALAQQAVELRPRNVRARLRLARCLWRVGEIAAALAEAEGVVRNARGQPGALLRVAAFYGEKGNQAAAYRCLAQAEALAPEDPRILAALADVCLARGKLPEAERLFDLAIYHDPDQVLLLERRGHTRVATEVDHQANQLGFVLDRLGKEDPRRAPVCYALAQELEDLGHFDAAFDIWAEGARCRRLALKDDVSKEGGLTQRVPEVFNEDWLAGLETAVRPQGESPFDTPPADDPIFLTGLPGSGVGLASALLARLPGVIVLQDPGFFSDAVTRAVGRCDDRAERLKRSASLDPVALAKTYGEATGALVSPSQRLVDSASGHLGLLGLLRGAFPAAKFIHMRRSPLDHCLALFTTLFPGGHPWSYSLTDTARYFSDQHRLLGHWRRHLPGGLLDLDYEMLVQSPSRATDRLADYLDLPPETRVAWAEIADQTVNASLGARGAHIGRWKSYETELRSLADRLRADGVPVD